MEITYVYHSCFTVRLNDVVILFDYPNNLGEEVECLIRKLVRGKRLVTLFSHGHLDHFNPNFLTLKDIVEEFYCVISYDIAEEYEELVGACTVVTPGDSLNLYGFDIVAFESSDRGVSYVLKINGVTLYFAGDNANWARKELSEELNLIIKRKFMNSIKSIANSFGSTDVAFTPICITCEDLGGITYVLTTLKPKLLIPIHLRGRTQIIRGLRTLLEKLAKNVFMYETLGDKVTF